MVSNNSIMGRKIVVIGGAGFIGSHVIEELLKEDVAEIIIFDNFSRGSFLNIENSLSDSRVKIFEYGGDILHADILDKAIEGKDYVIHLAALWLLHCQEFPRSAFHVNIEGTYNVIEACIKHNIKKLIFSSSASVYSDAIEIPMTEKHPFNNNTFYGATKIAGEHMLKALANESGLNYIGLRYMNVYGERQDYLGAYVSVIMKIIDNILCNKAPVIYGDGSQSYDFIYVKDTARANICALKSNKNNGFFNIGTGIGTTILELTRKIIDICDSDLKVEFDKLGKTFVKHRVGSIDAAEREIDFKYKVGLDLGLRDLIKWRIAKQ